MEAVSEDGPRTLNELGRGLRVVAWREVLRLLGQRPRLVASIATPLLFFGLFGAGFNRLVGQLLPGIDLIHFMFPGVVAMTVIMPSVFTGMSVVWDREFGFLREVLVAPVSRTGIAMGKIAGGALVATAEGLLVLLLGPIVGISLGPTQLAVSIGLMGLLATLLSAFGILIGVRISSQEAFQTVMALVVFPILFLSGVFFPVDATPGWLSLIAKINPATYGVDAIRQVILVPATSAAGGAGPGGAALPIGHPALGVSILGHGMVIWEEAVILAVLSAVLIAAASRTLGREG